MTELSRPSMASGHGVRSVTESVQRVRAAAAVQIDLPSRPVRIEATQPAAAFSAALADATERSVWRCRYFLQHLQYLRY